MAGQEIFKQTNQKSQHYEELKFYVSKIGSVCNAHGSLCSKILYTGELGECIQWIRVLMKLKSIFHQKVTKVAKGKNFEENFI